MTRPTETEVMRASLGELIDEYPLLENFTPLRRSRPWSLNTAYWNQRGLRAFTEDAVPYLATSDGSLSTATAELIAVRARATEPTTPRQLAVVEIGPGSGLFARLMVRHYLELRAAHPVLPSLIYIAVDSSREMLEGLTRTGMLSVPGVEVLLIAMDLTAEVSSLQAALKDNVPPGVPMMCVCNYCLDSLPATTLRWDGATLLEAEVELRARGDGARRADKAAMRMEGTRPDDLFVRTRYRPVAEEDPTLTIAKRFLIKKDAEIPFNAQAIALLQSLAQLEGRVELILVNDYGVDSLNGAAELVQYFGGSIAMGLHFPTIDAVVNEVLGWVGTAPAEHAETITSRLLTPTPDTELQHAFAELFSFTETKRAHAWVAVARRAKAEGQFERALSAFEAALTTSPGNWSLRVEAAHFVQTSLRRDDVALNLAQQVLEANPLCAQAWNIIGDCHYQTGDTTAARQAFENAVRLQANDARALLNMAYCHAKEGDFEEALMSISRGLVADRNGAFTNELLARQQEIIAKLSSH